MTTGELIAFLFQLVTSGGLIYVIITRQLDHRKNRDDLALQHQQLVVQRSQADIDADKRRDEQMSGLINTLLGQSIATGKLADRIDDSNKVNSASLEFRVRQAETEAQSRSDDRAALVNQTAAVAAFTPALAAGVETLTRNIGDSTKALETKVDEMGTDLTNKLDERLVDLKTSLDALTLTIENRLLPVPDQFAAIKDSVDVVRGNIEKTLVELGEFHKVIESQNEHIEQQNAHMAAMTQRLDALTLPAKAAADPADPVTGSHTGTITLDVDKKDAP